MPVPSEVMQKAQDAFWEVIAEHHPHITSGDFAPDQQHAFDTACNVAVEEWIANNTDGMAV